MVWPMLARQQGASAYGMNGPIKLLIVTLLIGLAASAMVSRLEASKPASPQAVAPPARPQIAQAPAQTGQAARPGQLASGVRVAIPADRLGQFSADVEIDGRRLKMLVDTGATYVSLSHEDAAGIGLRPQPHEFSLPLLTASGELKAARAPARSAGARHRRL